mmetsp:Transcript_23039/g.36892  ORF Transcript_23039/g.36892 Transcript_23039/m.36892 type:complete len:234 (-) Transcript_23039:548-1249(-)
MWHPSDAYTSCSSISRTYPERVPNLPARPPAPVPEGIKAFCILTSLLQFWINEVSMPSSCSSRSSGLTSTPSRLQKSRRFLNACGRKCVKRSLISILPMARGSMAIKSLLTAVLLRALRTGAAARERSSGSAGIVRGLSGSNLESSSLGGGSGQAGKTEMRWSSILAWPCACGRRSTRRCLNSTMLPTLSGPTRRSPFGIAPFGPIFPSPWHFGYAGCHASGFCGCLSSHTGT